MTPENPLIDAARGRDPVTAHTEQPELLPCPFCGDAPTMSKHFRYDAWSLTHRCKAIGAISFEFTESKESIVSRWNRRAPASQARVPLSEVEAIELGIEGIQAYESEGGTLSKALTLTRFYERSLGITQEQG